MCESRVDIYKISKPAACNFMKKVTHLQRFKFFLTAKKLLNNTT